MEEIVSYTPQSIIKGIDNDVIQSLNSYLVDLNRKPKTENIVTNKAANNSKYLPISFLEMKLDEIALGAWNTKNFAYQVVANEIVGSLELEFFHPLLKQWLVRIGAGAVQIQMDSGLKDEKGNQIYQTINGKQVKVKDPNFLITDITKKIQNTLTKDFPHLKAECFRNACLSIGKSFGRDLNREFTAEFNEFWTDKIEPVDAGVLKNIASVKKMTRKQIDSVLSPYGFATETINDITKDLFEIIKDELRNFEVQ